MQRMQNKESGLKMLLVARAGEGTYSSFGVIIVAT
jgi:hypothetical protein